MAVKNIRYLEVDREYAETFYRVDTIFICIYQGVCGNNFVKEVKLKPTLADTKTLTYHIHQIVKDLPENIHYSLRFYIGINNKGESV